MNDSNNNEPEKNPSANNDPKAAKKAKDKKIDDYLDGVLIKQLTWKNPVMVAIGIAIVQTAIASNGAEFWSDDVALPETSKLHPNCVGSAWRQMKNMGILIPMGRFQRSSKESRKGCKIYNYRLGKLSLAKAFLERNGIKVMDAQQELFKPTESKDGGLPPVQT